ncbi:MAG: hypothetical protein CL849_04725 [Crocinitomicaceae bacterium]|nr:hypothetical protein [Crocinitomicaceae bacterium]
MDGHRSARSFKTMGGIRTFDVCEYVCEMKAAGHAFELHVGCDSQNHRSHTVYVTTVVFRFPGAGAHVIYRKEKVPKIRDLWTKLWGETERSVALANLLRDEAQAQVEQIDLDFNTDPAHPSNKVLSASAGYVQSLGFQSGAKPGLLMAAWAADALCQ